ncbi:putative transcriptional regulator [Candidatus Sulfopaludibacter sp. SbA3]|nr:putative transcriptional regulator [Candidatus Sulfopaludibacter sp. SbA3]
MSKTLDQKLKELSPARRKKIGIREAALIGEEMSLRELRRAQRLTQKRMAEKLGIGQDGVSRLEQRSDLLVSTLRGYVKAMGGSLSIVAEFPDRQPVVLAGFATMEPESAACEIHGQRRAR